MVTKQDFETLETRAIRLGITNPFFKEIYFNYGEYWDNLPRGYVIEEERLLRRYSEVEVESMLKEKQIF